MTSTQPGDPVSPGEILAEELEAREWSQADFAEIIDRPAQLVSAVIAGKKSITPETATQIAAALGTTAQMWLNLQDTYDLSLAAQDRTAVMKLDEVRLRAEMNAQAPVTLLRKRGYLPDAPLHEQSQALLGLLGIASYDEEPDFEAAARRQNLDERYTPAQRAWLACARRDARRRTCAGFDAQALESLAERLSRTILTAGAFEDLPERLAAVGVRLVYVEAFPGSRISGASFLLDGDRAQPCIALSGRGKRLDIVLFTLLHEIAHIVRGDLEGKAPFIDEGEENVNEIEEATNRLAGSWCLPLPMDPPSQPRRQWVQSEAERQGVHPMVVVGRLQHQRLVDWKTDLVRGAPRVDDYLAAWNR